jgi:hypothetical protein
LLMKPALKRAEKYTLAGRERCGFDRPIGL